MPVHRLLPRLGRSYPSRALETFSSCYCAGDVASPVVLSTPYCGPGRSVVGGLLFSYIAEVCLKGGEANRVLEGVLGRHDHFECRREYEEDRGAILLVQSPFVTRVRLEGAPEGRVIAHDDVSLFF